MRKLQLCGVILFSFLSAFAQDFLSENEYFYTLPDKQSLFIAEDKTAKSISLALTFNCGAFVEDEEFDGLSFLYEKILAAHLKVELKQSVKDFATDTTLFSLFSQTSYEFVFLRVSFPEKYLDGVLKAVFRSVASPIDEKTLSGAVALSNAEYLRLHTDPFAKLDNAVGTILWSKNFSRRLYILEWNDSTSAGLKDRMKNMTEKYFCPANSLLVVRGNVKAKDVYESVKKNFNGWGRCSINLLGQFPGYNYRTILANVQMIFEDPLVVNPFYQIAFQGPNSFDDMKGNYCSLLLANILSNSESRLSEYLRDSCHLASVVLQNEMLRYISQLSLRFTPDSGYVAEGYPCFLEFLRGADDSLVDEPSLEAAKVSAIAAYNKNKADANEHVFLISRFWKSISINEYNTFEDSIRATSLADMRAFMEKYFRHRKHVAALSISPVLRDSLKIDSVFTNTATSVSDYSMHFLRNTAKFSSAADDSIFNSLVQFLKLNPEVKIKVNGNCHKDELLEVTDKEMFSWVHSHEHFVMNPPSLIKKKKFRLDVYRSLTVIKKLNELGIGIERLFGTGMLVRSPEEPETHQTVRCSEMIN